MCKAANGSSKMSPDLNFGFDITWRSPISVMGSRVNGRREELETVSLDNFLKGFWCKSEGRHGSGTEEIRLRGT